MLKVRLLLIALPLALALAARAETTRKDGDPTILVGDNAVRQAQLKRAFESFRNKLAILAGRLETSSDARDRDRAKSLRKVLAEASKRGVENRFEAVVRGLSKKDADKDIDTLNQVLRENSDLRKDLQVLLALLLDDGRGKKLTDLRDRAGKLLDQLKDLRDRQARLQAQTELGRKDDNNLKSAQDKLAKQTQELLDKLGKPDDREIDPEQARAVVQPVGQAGKEQNDAAGKLGKGDREGAGSAQGRAVGKLDEAIRRIEDILRQIRKEERERTLADLLARCKRMLGVQESILEGSEQLFREMRRSSDTKPTLPQAARSNRLADSQNNNLRLASATLEIVRSEGSAVAFAEVFEQLIQDMDVVHNRLSRTEIDKVTLTVEDDIIQTLRDAIKALEKAISDNTEEGPQTPPGDGPGGKPKLVNVLQQLKMIHALQRRVNDRTKLYGKRYQGEQAPAPPAAKTPREKSRFERIAKELKDLAGRQERIARVTREIGKEEPDLGLRRID